MESKNTSASRQHGPDLALMRLGREMRRRINPRTTLANALRDAVTRVQADAVLLHIPACGLRLAVTAPDSEVSSDITAAFERMPEQLVAGDAAATAARVIQGDETAEACRLLIIPADSGSPRAPAWLVFARTLAAPRFDTWTTVLGQAQALRLMSRLVREVDSLSGHLTRSGLHSVISQQSLPPGALLLAELDGLRTLCHTLGAIGGDEAIAACGRLLTEPLLPAGASVAHLGSGRFAVALPGIDTTAAMRIGEKVQQALTKIVLEGASSATRLSCTCGIVACEFSAFSLDRALQSADAVLELAGEKGRARIEIRDHDDATMIRRYGEDLAASELLESIASGDLELHAQRIVSLRDNRHPPSFELLLKSRSSEGSQSGAYPVKLIEVAQRYQMLSALDRYVVDRAFAMLEPHREVLARHRATVAINVSGQSLTDADFVTHFMSELARSQLPPECIVVEVTEQVALADLQRAGAAMGRLRAAGCGIAIDDFGTGANSLAYVHQLPVTRLKIDGSFVRDITVNKRSEAAVKGIVQLAHDFVLQTVGEHVETVGQADLLRKLGVDFGQGFLFGRAEPLDDAIALLAERDATATRFVLNVG